jgi:hypothetical protein
MDLVNNVIINNHTIRCIDGLYSLNDLHKASGGLDKHQPAFFMRNQETKDLIAELENETKLSSANLQTIVKKITGKGLHQGTYVCKELVYRYAMWISAKFTLLVIRTFDAIATGKTLQQQFLIADKELKTATEIASHAGYTLNHVGKKVKPVKKRIRDNLLEKLQIALPFFESKAV